MRWAKPGECFDVVESGRAEMIRDGRVVETPGRGDCFGEIALLRASHEQPPFAHPRTHIRA
jgi:CRP-like cAMP-binding protein